MEDIQKMLQKFLTAVVIVGEPEGISGTLVFVEFVLEKRQTQENFQEFENQVGRMSLTYALVL